MRVHINRDKCTGHGVCESLAPEVFEVRDDGLAYVMTELPAEDLRAAVEDACDQCPVEALTVEE